MCFNLFEVWIVVKWVILKDAKYMVGWELNYIAYLSLYEEAAKVVIAWS